MAIVGWISQVAFCICGAPLAYQAWRDKYIEINFYYLLLWTIGEVFGMAYAVYLKEAPLMFNYICNGIFLGIVWKYRGERSWKSH